MTAFTTGANGWQPSGSAYCADVDTSSITFENAGEPQNSNSWTGWPKSKTWRVVIHGHDAIDYPNDTTPSNNGMAFVSHLHECSAIADDGNMSVVVSILGDSQFYPKPHLPHAGNRTDDLRFLDMLQGGKCKGADLTDARVADEDFCERMAQVDITLNANTATPTIVPSLKCKDGDCSVGIGLPPS
jgi:hypothetical protein